MPKNEHAGTQYEWVMKQLNEVQRETDFAMATTIEYVEKLQAENAELRAAKPLDDAELEKLYQNAINLTDIDHAVDRITIRESNIPKTLTALHAALSRKQAEVVKFAEANKKDRKGAPK